MGSVQDDKWAPFTVTKNRLSLRRTTHDQVKIDHDVASRHGRRFDAADHGVNGRHAQCRAGLVNRRQRHNSADSRYFKSSTPTMRNIFRHAQAQIQEVAASVAPPCSRCRTDRRLPDRPLPFGERIPDRQPRRSGSTPREAQSHGTATLPGSP